MNTQNLQEANAEIERLNQESDLLRCYYVDAIDSIKAKYERTSANDIDLAWRLRRELNAKDRQLRDLEKDLQLVRELPTVVLDVLRSIRELGNRYRAAVLAARYRMRRWA